MNIPQKNFREFTDFAKRLGDTVAVMDDGRVVHAGSMAQLAGDDELQQRLLGLSLDSPDLLDELDRRFADQEGEIRWADLRTES